MEGIEQVGASFSHSNCVGNREPAGRREMEKTPIKQPAAAGRRPAAAAAAAAGAAKNTGQKQEAVITYIYA